MIEFLGVLGLFLLRLGIPLLLTYLFARYLKHMDEKWRAEGLERAGNLGRMQEGSPDIRCWDVRECRPETRSTCPAYGKTAPCWEFFRVDGKLNRQCSDCDVVEQAMAPLAV